jgi:biofilm PGA synthesis N-glycosyltransferase PgaC
MLDSSVMTMVQSFLIGFPGVLAIFAIVMSRQFEREATRNASVRMDRHHELTAIQRWPTLSVIVPAKNEEVTICKTIDSILALDWPHIDLVVVNDGSTDGTRERLRSYVGRNLIRVLDKEKSEGKARGLNDAIRLTHGDLIMIVDSDCLMMPAVARLMARHFVHDADVGAVTANPRVVQTSTLLEKLQAIEFSATVSTARRGQAVWGRILTISGICALFRREALLKVGGFDPKQPTEDIEITWRMNLSDYRVTYEPTAVIGMSVPSTGRAWLRQRRRWARGLVRVVKCHFRAALKQPRQWPFLVEATLSILWCHLMAAVLFLYFVAWSFGVQTSSASLFFGQWGIALYLLCALQVVWGMRLDSRRDAGIWSVAPWIPLFAAYYWCFSAFTVVSSTIPEMLTRRTEEFQWEVTRKS